MILFASILNAHFLAFIAKKTDHAVLVIGYGEENETPYWIIKNSWGTLWGDDGFMKISMKNDLCGVLNNGPLMVSVGGWINETVGYPFEKLKKQTHNEDVSQNKQFHTNQAADENEIFDLFTRPDHVTSYIKSFNREKA